MDANTLRRLNWLWKYRHTHDDDPDIDQQITIINNTISEVVGQGTGSGAYVHLTRSSTQSIDATGELIEWESEYSVIPHLEFNLTLPVTEITIPKDGYYNVSVQLGWDSFLGGGNVKIVRNPSVTNIQVWPPMDDPGLWTTDAAQFFEGEAPALPFSAGDTVGIWLDPDDASAQDLASATLAVYLVDRVPATLPIQSYVGAVLEDGPIAYWRLDETSGSTAFDSAGHALGPFDATYTNSPDLNQAGVMDDGTNSPSVGLDGTKHIVGDDWDDLEFAGTAAFTLECWAVADDVTEVAAILMQKQESPSPFNGWDFYRSEAHLRFNRQANPFGSLQVVNVFTVGVRYYLVAVYDGTNMSLYVDGVLAGQTASSASIGANTEILSIGRDLGAADWNWIGRIDEVAIYDYALAEDRIALHYEIGSRGF